MDPMGHMPIYAASVGQEEEGCPARAWGTLTETLSYPDQVGAPWQERGLTKAAS